MEAEPPSLSTFLLPESGLTSSAPTSQVQPPICNKPIGKCHINSEKQKMEIYSIWPLAEGQKDPVMPPIFGTLT